MYPVSRVWEVWQVHGPVPLHSWAPLHGFAETAWPSATERHYPCLSGLVRFEEKPIINFPTQGWLDRVDSGEGCASPLLLPCDHEHWSSNWLWFCWEEGTLKGACFKRSFCSGWTKARIDLLSCISFFRSLFGEQVFFSSVPFFLSTNFSHASSKASKGRLLNKCGNFSQIGDPQCGNVFPILLFGRSPMLKTVKQMEVGFG